MCRRGDRSKVCLGQTEPEVLADLKGFCPEAAGSLWFRAHHSHGLGLLGPWAGTEPSPFAEVAHRGCAPGKTRPFGWLPGERGEGDAGASLVLSQRRVPSSEFSLCLQNGRQVFGSEGPHVGKHQDQVSQRVSWTGPRERQASAGNVRRESLADSPACLDHAVWL